jgi:molybdate transport system substrate-binding protein
VKKLLLATAASMLVLGLALSPNADVQAAELQILAGGAMTAPLRQLAADFEKDSGHKLVFRFGTTPELIRLVTTGGPFDLAVVPVDVAKDPGARDQLAAGPTTDIARVGLGIAVRSSAPRPDISTPDALKQTLLRAQSIATIPASATGTQVLRVFDALGIGEAMKAKTRAQPAPAQVVESVASGEVELAVFLMNVLTAPGLDVVGPFPAELQQEVVFTGAVAANAREAAAAKAFLRYLTTPAAAAVIRAKGMNPG